MTHRRRFPIVRREDGQSAVEFALLLPFFLFFMLLVVEFGLLMWSAVSVANASREGARFAAANCGAGTCTVQAVKDRVIARSGGVLQPADAGEITVAWPDGRLRGDPVSIGVEHPHTLLFLPNLLSLLGGGGSGDIPVRSCTSMRLEAEDTAGTSAVPAPPGSYTC